WRVVGGARSHRGPHEAWADDEDRDAALELLREHVSESPDGGLARRVGGAAGVWEVGGSAAGDHDSAAVTREHPRDHSSAAQVDAQHVHLENGPPVFWLDL